MENINVNIENKDNISNDNLDIEKKNKNNIVVIDSNDGGISSEKLTNTQNNNNSVEFKEQLIDKIKNFKTNTESFNDLVDTKFINDLDGVISEINRTYMQDEMSKMLYGNAERDHAIYIQSLEETRTLNKIRDEEFQKGNELLKQLNDSFAREEQVKLDKEIQKEILRYNFMTKNLNDQSIHSKYMNNFINEINRKDEIKTSDLLELKNRFYGSANLQMGDKTIKSLNNGDSYFKDFNSEYNKLIETSNNGVIDKSAFNEFATKMKNIDDSINYNLKTSKNISEQINNTMETHKNQLLNNEGAFTITHWSRAEGGNYVKKTTNILEEIKNIDDLKEIEAKLDDIMKSNLGKIEQRRSNWINGSDKILQDINGGGGGATPKTSDYINFLPKVGFHLGNIGNDLFAISSSLIERTKAYEVKNRLLKELQEIKSENNELVANTAGLVTTINEPNPTLEQKKLYEKEFKQNNPGLTEADKEYKYKLDNFIIDKEFERINNDLIKNGGEPLQYTKVYDKESKKIKAIVTDTEDNQLKKLEKMESDLIKFLEQDLGDIQKLMTDIQDSNIDVNVEIVDKVNNALTNNQATIEEYKTGLNNEKTKLEKLSNFYANNPQFKSDGIDISAFNSLNDEQKTNISKTFDLELVDGKFEESGNKLIANDILEKKITNIKSKIEALDDIENNLKENLKSINVLKNNNEEFFGQNEKTELDITKLLAIVDNVSDEAHEFSVAKKNMELEMSKLEMSPEDLDMARFLNISQEYHSSLSDVKDKLVKESSKNNLSPNNSLAFSEISKFYLNPQNGLDQVVKSIPKPNSDISMLGLNENDVIKLQEHFQDKKDLLLTVDIFNDSLKSDDTKLTINDLLNESNKSIFKESPLIMDKINKYSESMKGLITILSDLKLNYERSLNNDLNSSKTGKKPEELAKLIKDNQIKLEDINKELDLNLRKDKLEKDRLNKIKNIEDNDKKKQNIESEGNSDFNGIGDR